MKRNLTTIATVVMMVLSLSSFATANPSLVKDHATRNIVSNYLHASVFGKQKIVKEMLADDFEYINTADNSKANKKDYSKFLKDTDNLIYICATTYEILDETGKSAIAKATFKFENFTRVDILNLTETKDGWKISKVITNYL